MSDGGGGYLYSCQEVFIEHCEFHENKADGGAKGPGRGGAFFAEHCGEVRIVKNTKFLDNSAAQFGGAVALGRPVNQGVVAILDCESRGTKPRLAARSQSSEIRKLPPPRASPRVKMYFCRAIRSRPMMPTSTGAVSLSDTP